MSGCMLPALQPCMLQSNPKELIASQHSEYCLHCMHRYTCDAEALHRTQGCPVLGINPACKSQPLQAATLAAHTHHPLLLTSQAQWGT
jgi:hypothetical protein